MYMNKAGILSQFNINRHAVPHPYVQLPNPSVQRALWQLDVRLSVPPLRLPYVQLPNPSAQRALWQLDVR
jgi:hypothetical protein